MQSRRIPFDVKPVEPPVFIEVTMTESEAETLLAITRRIGGLPNNSRRKHTDALGQALKAAGVRLSENNLGDLISNAWLSEQARSIQFVPNSLPEDERSAK